MSRFRRDDPIRPMFALTLIWAGWIVATVWSYSSRQSAPGPVAIFVKVWLDNLSYVLGFGALLTAGVVGGWIVVLVQRRLALMPSKSVDELRQLSPGQFEDWCAARLRERGYRVNATGGRSDHGIDLIAERDGERIVVQCKRYGGNTRPIGEPTVRDLLGAMHHHRATRAMLVTTGQFTQAARDWSRGEPIDLLDAEQLWSLTPPPAVDLEAAAASAPSSLEAGQCPRCGKALVTRTNGQSKTQFWGCSAFPKCWYKRDL